MNEEYIISKKQAIENGIDFSSVDLCRQIRRLALCDRISLDENMHRGNPHNKHLFSYIQYCGIEPVDYIKSYLSSLQPYMIQRLLSQKQSDRFICAIDNAYRISLYIKLDKTKGNEVIVSFHENDNYSQNGIARNNNSLRPLIDEIVPVFGEPTGAWVDGSSREEIKVFIQRGMLVIPVRVMAQLCEGNIYLVERGSIEAPIVDHCNQYLRDLYTSNVDLESLKNVEIFSVLQQISFTSYGNTIASNLTLLIDNMEIQRGIPSRKAADFALTTYINHLYLTQEQAQELMEVLDDKYSVSPSIETGIIINRVKDELFATAIETQKIIDSTSV